ncbi:MAG: hypothetical protein GC164_14315 [Phycisphaera sp.]|nr:hypothetical protein [Phycisphaera sp.]
MSAFEYLAIDTQGRKVTGTLDADARNAAVSQLRNKGLTPVRVGPLTRTQITERPTGSKLTRRGAEDFCRELSNLLSAGISMSRALGILCRQTSRRGAGVIRSIHDKVTGGSTLADAMRQNTGSFTHVETAMVRAGESGGFLDVVLGQIADFQSRERDLGGRIKNALAYPMVLATVATGVMVLMLTYFIPKFSVMFNGLGGKLPALTRGIVAASDLLLHRGLFVLAVILVAVMVIRRSLKSPSGRLRMERLLLVLPGVGLVVSRLALVRFSRMLGTLLAAGVPMVSSLRVAAEALGNQELSQTMHKSIEEVVRGRSLARSLESCGRLFPLSVIETLAVAEEAGRLDKELIRLAGVYEQELDRQLRLLVSLAEPAMLFIMATLVGTIVIGMMLPIFSMQELIK